MTDLPEVPTSRDGGETIEHWTNVAVTTHDGRMYDAELLMGWSLSNPLVVTFRLHRQGSGRWWSVGITEMIAAIGEDPNREIGNPASTVAVWRGEGDRFSQMVKFGRVDKRLFQGDLRPVAQMIAAVGYAVEEKLGGSEAVINNYLAGGTAALEMLANGGLAE